MRNTLVDGQGNFGSVDGDPPAAYRYTEARLEALAEAMMDDLDKDTVDYVPNFDETTTEPTVLPTVYPNLLVNGSTGIAVGMATNIPPHNMREVIDGVVWLIEQTLMAPAGSPTFSREQKLRELIRLIPGPDFPTGGLIVGRRGIHEAYVTGRGGIQVRAKAEIEPMKKGDRQQIVIDGDPLPGQQGEADRAHRRPGPRQDHRGHLRHPRRVRPRRHAGRHRAEARRGRRGRPQQPLQAHPAAADLRHHHAGDRRRPAAGAVAARGDRALHRLPPRGRPPPDRVRAAQGRGARPHPRRAADRPRQPRRGDHADPRVEDHARGQGRPDHHVRAVARSRRRPSSTCSCSASPAWSARRSSTSWPSCCS